MVLIQLPHRLFAEINHFLRRIGDGKQRARRLVDAGVSRLRGQHHCDQQCVGVEMFELSLGLGIGLAKREKASWTWALVQGFNLGLASAWRSSSHERLHRFRYNLLCRTGFRAGGSLRVIFGIKGIY